MKYLGLFVILLNSMACQNTNNVQGQDFETYEYVPRPTIEPRDEQYILHTVKSFIKANFYTYGYYNDTSEYVGLSLARVKLEAERIFYSPDKLKMVIWIFFKVPNNEDYALKKQDYYYNAEALIGFRKQPDAPWLIYPFNEFSVNGSSTKDKLRSLMGQYYFDKMAEDAQYVNENYLDENYGGEVDYDKETKQKQRDTALENPFVMKKFGYNLDDDVFWDKSLVWQKGARITGYYNFQTRGNVTPNDKEPLRKPPKITYPAEILSQYD